MKTFSAHYFTSLLISSLIIVLTVAGCHNSTLQEKENSNAGDSGWKVIGPGGGGGVMKPTISPFDENLVMTHCDMTAAYLSFDGGENWKMKNLWNVPEDFEFDPADENVIYVATRGFRHDEDRGSGLSILCKSKDKGQSWEIVFPDVTRAKKGFDRLQNYNYLPSEIVEDAIDGTIGKISVDPGNNQVIFLGMTPLKYYISQSDAPSIPDSAMLVRSSDQGKSWEKIANIPGKNVMAIFTAGDLGLQDEVIVFTDEACMRFNENTGETIRLPLPVDRLIAVEGGKGNNESLIYIQSAFSRSGENTEGGMYVSTDIGNSWVQSNTGLFETVAEGRRPGFRKGLAVCETRPEVAYVSVILPEANEKGTTNDIYSIYKTTDGGKNWSAVLRSSSPGGYLTGNFEGSWMEKSYDPGWGGAPIDLGVAPQNPDICHAGDNGRGYKTTDGGKTWKQTYSHNLSDGSYASGGLDVTTCYGVHFDPFDKNHFFICYTDMGLFHTFNGGLSWFHSLTNIPRPWQNTCYDLKFDPEVKGKIWSVWANAHDLPRTKMFSPRGFNNYQGGVAVSHDNGLSWEKSNNGIPENAVCTNVLIDPESPATSRILYVTVFDKGVYKSEDGGENWKEANTGLGDNKFAWQIRRNSKGRLFVVCSRGLKNNNTVDGKIYFSDDNAATWNLLTLPDGVNGPHDLLIDYEDAQKMYLSSWPRKTDRGDSYGGVYKTEDAGKTWKQVFDERVRVNSGAIDPNHPDIVYINTFQNAAYRSADAGENWKRIEGYRFKWGQRPVPDPNNPGMLFLTTYGGSVYYGPAEGTPGAKDDITNMPENWW